MTARRLPLPRRHPRDIASAQDGVTIVEFALIAPALMVLLLGALDVGHTLYMQSVLQGTVQKAARDGSLESAAGTVTTQRDAIDTMVRDQLLTLNRAATVKFNRRFYKTFSDAAAAKAEEFTDSAVGSPFRDGKCNNYESFVDANNNGRFDRDGGDSADRAGARDNVVYTVTIQYDRMFPIDRLIGGNGLTTLSAATVLSNQPYGDQSSTGTPTVAQCGLGAPNVEAPSP
ncbi:TadE/TadG family type IV pilus assembly protein [Sphingobium lignivorans]|uniref:Flp pilus assembly pilin Flp n=1 Tax=Sphingobium lignivorans TaxID=2735886 RepID=A0ABR6NG96_9SPHN|nr:TadE/TadG family type IV pilus assembly protein [Sphingobium lignivorans]MBB5986310.1 Flp pilus assembly pilin Flp [Sphingobium lignivorans]